MTPLSIQIMRRLRQVAIWRYVGLVSSTVGLVCYALSSSFNYLFGEWNLFKIILYCTFGFFICLWSLFAKVCQRSTSLRFKAHSAFLVLTITSVYSYFGDKAMNGKPDAYSVISCAAFAIMSLSLSRQTECGFEVDLFYFFLGCLVVVLMKIKFALAIIGVGFSYAFIILRSFLDTTSQQNLAVQNDHSVVINVNSQQLAHTCINSTRHDLSEGASQLMTCMEAIKQGDSNLTNMLYEHVKNYLRDNSDLEVMDHNLYECVSAGQHNNVLDAAASGTINELREIAKQMMGYGFGKEWSDVYTSRRREFLEESISRLGFLKISTKDVHEIEWQYLSNKIKQWTKVSNIALKVLFPGERRFCDYIYLGESNSADISFMEICKDPAIQLLNFAETLATGSHSPERLFRILDVFETLRDLIPEFEALFSDHYSVSPRNEAITIWKRVGEAIRDIFMELENSIRRHPAQIAVPGGGLHPITRYVMNYLLVACRSRQTLEQVFEHGGHPLTEYYKLDDLVSSSSSSSSLLMQMYRIMELLESNLEVKSKAYKDPALCYVFLMNNARYIVHKTEHRELGTLLGYNWIQKHATKVQQFRVHYQRSSWNKVLEILKLDDNGSVPPNGLAKSMKEKIKTFNAVFEEICREQSSWFVFDEQLREEIRISLEKILLPAYVNFVGRFQSVPELGKHADNYVKYRTEDIQTRLNELFQGSGSAGSRK